MDALSQTEIVDERKGRLKFLERTGVGSIGFLGLIAGLTTSPLPQDFNLYGRFSAVQIPLKYDDLIAREFPPLPIPADMRRPLTVTRPVASSFRNRELEWRRINVETLKQYENEWVVLEGEEIVAHGRDPVLVINEAKSRGVRTPYIFFVEQKTENEVMMGL